MLEGNLIYLVAALTIIWLVIIGYLAMLSGRITALQRELDSLKRREDGSEPDGDEL